MSKLTLTELSLPSKSLSHLPKPTKKILAVATGLAILALITPFAIYAAIALHYAPKAYPLNQLAQLPHTHVALVLGASVDSDGVPSPILADRVRAAVQLYQNHKIDKLLMSGDDRSPYYNEPQAMTMLAENLGVPAQDIQNDYAGRRTYDSCWRAKNIFSQDNIIIVTQSFHMTRALFLCTQLGIHSVGYLSDESHYAFWDWDYWQVRDIFSLDLSLLNVFVKNPAVVKGEKIQL